MVLAPQPTNENEYADESGPKIEVAEDLPDLVDENTGEENEEVMFDERAKLFRFVNKQWKERGVGQMRMLKHTSKATHRLVMRREQVLKPCANHYISDKMVLEAFGEKGNSFTWTALDYADTEEPNGRVEIFVIRFKTVEIAGVFRNQFEAAQKGTGGGCF